MEHERRFSGAVRADQRDFCAGLHRQRHITQGYMSITIGEAQMINLYRVVHIHSHQIA